MKKHFGKNLEKLLLTPPMKDKVVLGFDPAYRTGCKLAVIDATSRILNISKIYPHEPHNKWDEAKKIIVDLIRKFNIDIIAVGNGTASRESERLVAEVVSEYKDKKIEYIIVSEAGASVYSASKLATEEYPDINVSLRGAISIARRLQDPLAELVKIVRESVELINDKLTLEEMLTFVRNEKGRPEAQQGAHDDLVMGLAIAYYSRSQVIFDIEPINVIQQFNFKDEEFTEDYGEEITVI